MTDRLRADATAIYQAALRAADAGEAVRRAFAAGLPVRDFDSYNNIDLLAIGKAAVPMALACEQSIGRPLRERLAVTKASGDVFQPDWVRESGHPVPDDAGLEAAAETERLLDRLREGDLLVVALSGGASALLPAPVEPLGLAGKSRVTGELLRAGADIYELNTVRKHLSRLKGGQLALRAAPATVMALILSDVIGDDLSVIGSGPTAPDPSSVADAAAVLQRFGLGEVIPCLRETPKPDNPCFQSVHNVIVGSNSLSLNAAAEEARRLGYATLILSSSVDGEAREVARVHAAILREIARTGRPVSRPACVLSGGETTVTVRGTGKGGRNQEFALAAALQIRGLPQVLVASLGTDGTDGPTDAAGAVVFGDTCERAEERGLRAAEALGNNDSYPFFDSLDDLIRTGATGTNVMDLQILLAG